MQTSEIDLLRESKIYYIEEVFITGDHFRNGIKISFEQIKSDTLRKMSGRPVVYSIAIDSFIIRHAPNFNETDREVLFLQSSELQPSSRYILMITSNLGSGLASSTNLTIQKTLPDFAIFKLGFLNLINIYDKMIYDPNYDLNDLNFSTQLIMYATFRFKITAHYT